MNVSKLLQDIETGALTEVVNAACVYDDNARGVQVRQSFYVYPDDRIVCLNSADGGNDVLTLRGAEEVIFRSIHKSYFQ